MLIFILAAMALHVVIHISPFYLHHRSITYPFSSNPTYHVLKPPSITMAAVNVQQQPQPGPQPDFQALSGSLQGTSVEVGRCSSLANQGITVQNAATQLTEQLESAISTLTQTLTQAINGLGDEMRQGMQDLRLSLDDL